MLGLAAPLAVAACAPPDRDLPIADYRALPGFRSDAPHTVATFAVGALLVADGQVNPVRATCSARGAGFRVDFTTPSRITFPEFATGPQEMTIACRHGESEKTAVLRADEPGLDQAQATLGRARLFTPCTFGQRLFGYCTSPRQVRDAAQTLETLRATPVSERKFSYPSGRINFKFQG